MATRDKVQAETPLRRFVGYRNLPYFIAEVIIRNEVPATAVTEHLLRPWFQPTRSITSPTRQG
jgi:hypothetical protein